MSHINFSVFSGEIYEEPSFETVGNGNLLLKFKVKTEQPGFNEGQVFTEKTSFEAWGKNAQRIWDSGLIKFGNNVLVWGARKKTSSNGKQGNELRFFTNYVIENGATVLPIGSINALGVRPMNVDTGAPEETEEVQQQQAPRSMARTSPMTARQTRAAAPPPSVDDDEDIPF